MIVKWNVETGYVNRMPAREVEVDDEELAECATDEEREDLIGKYIEEAFRNEISWYRVN